ncbi:hypothetical protein A9487_21160 [Bacillus cereus]|nr:hypothetical protein A9487_21160 [Bacillus cereus]
MFVNKYPKLTIICINKLNVMKITKVKKISINSCKQQERSVSSNDLEQIEKANPPNLKKSLQSLGLRYSWFRYEYAFPRSMVIKAIGIRSGPVAFFIRRRTTIWMKY